MTRDRNLQGHLLSIWESVCPACYACSGKVNGQLIGVQVIRATIKVSGNPAHFPGIHIDGFIAQALEFQGPEVVLVQVVESVLFGCFHDKLLVVSARNWTNHKVT